MPDGQSQSTGALRIRQPINRPTDPTLQQSVERLNRIVEGLEKKGAPEQTIRDLDFPAAAPNSNTEEITRLLQELQSQTGYKQTATELKNASLVFSVFKGLLHVLGAFKSKEISVEVAVASIKASEKMKIEFIRGDGKVFARLAE